MVTRKQKPNFTSCCHCSKELPEGVGYWAPINKWSKDQIRLCDPCYEQHIRRGNQLGEPVVGTSERAYRIGKALRQQRNPINKDKRQ